MAGTEIQDFLAPYQDRFGSAMRVHVGCLPLVELVQGVRNFSVELTLTLHELDSVFSLSGCVCVCLQEVVPGQQRFHRG